MGLNSLSVKALDVSVYNDDIVIRGVGLRTIRDMTCDPVISRLLFAGNSFLAQRVPRSRLQNVNGTPPLSV
jgi:hypothetical protein